MENASEGRKGTPALEETTGRTISEMERPKFLMFDPDSRRESLRNFSGMQEIVRLFLPRRDFFVHFWIQPKMDTYPRKEAQMYDESTVVRRLFA
jgi:hypothetical protein